MFIEFELSTAKSIYPKISVALHKSVYESKSNDETRQSDKK